jgi:hypothetical protein
MARKTMFFQLIHSGARTNLLCFWWSKDETIASCIWFGPNQTLSKPKFLNFHFPGFSWPAAGGGTAGIENAQFLIATTNVNQGKPV